MSSMVYNRAIYIMKRALILNIFMLLASLLIFSFTSCRKDGVYTPKRQISEIYREDSNGMKELQERWFWNGKLLDKIHFIDGTDVSVLLYKYEKKRLVSAISTGGGYKFFYDGSKLSRIEGWDMNTMVLEIKVVHTKNKITELEINHYDNKHFEKNGNSLNFALSMRGILPESTCKNLPEMLTKSAQNGEKGIEISTIYYTYEGKNIKEEKYIKKSYQSLTSFEYDKKVNPFYNLLLGGHSPLDYEFSQNNITQVYSTNTSGDTLKYGYNYIYEKDFPIERRSTKLISGYSGEVYYYEYIK